MDKRIIVLCGVDTNLINRHLQYIEDIFDGFNDIVTDVKYYDGYNGLLGPMMAEFLDAQLDLDIAGVVLLQNLRKHMCGPDNADVTLYKEYPDILYAKYLSNFDPIDWKDITDDIKKATCGNIYKKPDVIIYLDQLPQLVNNPEDDDMIIRRDAYMYCAAKFGWDIVQCFCGNIPRTDEQIKSDVMDILFKHGCYFPIQTD